jgi:hypothetical protein
MLRVRRAGLNGLGPVLGIGLESLGSSDGIYDFRRSFGL